MRGLISAITSTLKKLKVNRRIRPLIIFFLLSIFCASVNAEETDKDGNMLSPFGVLEFLHWNHPWNNYKYSSKKDLEKVVALMKKAGVGWVRMDFLWAEIEPQAGNFSFAKYDEIVDLLSRNNLNILGILDYSADWAKSCPEWNCPPRENKLFADYASRVIGRYKDRIKYWEVWNEPDSYTYWSKQDGLKSYCALLKEVYIAAKKADPDCKILNGGLAGGLASVNKLYDHGAKDYFDILNIHIFDSPLHNDSIKRVTAYPKLAHKVMSRNGDGHKKIWVTEIGCPGVKPEGTIANWWMGANPSEAEQARWVRQVYTYLLRAPAVEKVFWAFFRDCQEHWANGIDYFGLVRWDYSRKSSFKAYQECFNSWKKAK